MDEAAVVSVGAPPANLTTVESVSAKVAVLDPVPSCVMMMVTLCPVPKLSILKSQLPVSVMVCTGARLQSTFTPAPYDRALMSSVYVVLNLTLALALIDPVPAVLKIKSSFDLDADNTLSAIDIASLLMLVVAVMAPVTARVDPSNVNPDSASNSVVVDPMVTNSFAVALLIAVTAGVAPVIVSVDPLTAVVMLAPPAIFKSSPGVNSVPEESSPTTVMPVSRKCTKLPSNSACVRAEPLLVALVFDVVLKLTVI